MNTNALARLRRKLAADEPVYGLWITLDSASISEIGVALDVDWIVIDAEHGHLDWGDIVAHLRSGVRSETVMLVRVAELNIALIKRALDIGADGIVIPWVETAAQLQQAVKFAHYPIEGLRGIGAERATGWGQCFADHVRTANQNVLVIPIIETVAAGKNIDALLNVPGVELLFFGPADFSSTAGYAGQWEGPGVAEQILSIKDKIRAAGKNCGVISTGIDDLLRRRDQGFRMIGLGADAGLLIRSLRGALAAVGREQQITPTFRPVPGAPLQ